VTIATVFCLGPQCSNSVGSLSAKIHQNPPTDMATMAACMLHDQIVIITDFNAHSEADIRRVLSKRLFECRCITILAGSRELELKNRSPLNSVHKKTK